MSDVTAPLSDSSPADDGTSHYACGTQFGRYVILESVGSGGAGTVYAAFDPHLDRRVALKLLHEGRGYAALVSEARTLARLTHPNVVTVHDVGTHDGQVFVAMELIEGEDLATWLCRVSPDREQIVRAFIEAGRGLQAAHDRGIVHRDFKPRNVLVSFADDKTLRTVKVGDFGLAQPVVGGAHRTRDDDEAVSGSGDTDRPAGLHGTPAYMAPEQYEGEPVDARTDQYAFCVSLFEALTKERPFSGTIYAVAEAKRDGPPDWPKDDPTPRWLTRLVLRGLAPRPADRWPSMAELLARLQAGDPRRVLARRGALAVAAIGLLGAGAYAGAFGDRALQQCSGARVELEPVWNPQRRDAVAESLAAIPSSFAQDTADRVTAGLQSYVDAWATTHRAACEATGRGEQSAQRLDESMACLQRRSGALDALLGVLEHPDVDVLAHAVRAVEDLSDPASCRDPQDVGGDASWDPVTREQVESLRADLGRVEAIASAARYDDAWVKLQPLRERASSLRHPPLEGEVALLQGRLLGHRGDLQAGLQSLREAYAVGLRTSHFDLAVEAGREVAALQVSELQDHRAGMRWLEHLRPLADRQGPRTRTVARVRILQAAAWREAGRFDDAEAELRAVQDMLPGIVEPHDQLYETLGNSFGHLYMATGKYRDALRVYEEGRDFTVRTLGEEHPKVAKETADMGMAYSKLEEYDRAIELLRDALARIEKALGPDHHDVATVKLNLAAALGNDDRTERSAEAMPLLEEVVAVYERVYGEDSINLYRPLANLAALYKTQRKPDRALELILRSVALQERTLGDDHPALCDTLLNLSATYLHLGRYEEAVAASQRMLRIAEASFERPNPDVAQALLSLANLALARDRFEDALRYYERAEAEFDAMGPDASGMVTMILGGRAYALTQLERPDEAGRVYLQATQRGFKGSNLLPWERAMIQLEAGKWLHEHPDAHPQGKAAAVALVEAALADAELAKDWGTEFRTEAQRWLRRH